MVAYSSTYCLPCFEATDSPCLNTGTVCEPSTVWCDLVNIVETQLNAVDVALSRTATAIPLASVTGTEPLTSDSIVTVAFNTVEYDTDGMVNLDVNSTIVTPQRDGIYMVYGHLVTNALTSATDGFEHTLTILAGSDSSISVNPEVSVYQSIMYISTQSLFRWQVGVSTPFSLEYNGIPNDFAFARLSVWWVCDL